MIVKISCINSLQEALAVAKLHPDIIEIIVDTKLGVDTRSKTKIEADIILKKLKNKVQTCILTDKTEYDSLFNLISTLEFNYLFPIDLISNNVIKKLKLRFPALKIAPTVHVLDRTAIQQAVEFDQNPYIDLIHLDSKVKNQKGGTGKTHDWSISQEIVKSVKKPVILAGGLSPDNVEESIMKVRPYGVDVYSGVLDSNRNLDLNKVKNFISIARSTE